MNNNAHQRQELHVNDRPIPREIHYIWVGGVMRSNDPKIPFIPSYREGIQYTKEKLAGDPAFQINLWLSKIMSIGSAYAENVAWATDMGLTIRDIDNELTLQPMEQNAINWEVDTGNVPGGKSNYGAVSDILRVAILDQHGGMYIDTDCVLRRRPRDDELIPKYGFFAASTKAYEPAQVVPAQQSLQPKPKKSLFCCFGSTDDVMNPPRPSNNVSINITNSVLASVAGGQYIMRYRAYIQLQYQELAEKFNQNHDAIVQKLFDTRADGTLVRSGPQGLKLCSHNVFMIGEHDVVKFWWDTSPIYDEFRRAIVLPDYVAVQYGNSWLLPKKNQEPVPQLLQARAD
jgi:hypothetical protein